MDKSKIRASSADILKILEHDINNLLGIVMGYLDLALLDKKGISLKSREGLTIAKDAVDELCKLIYDFTDVAKIKDESLFLYSGKSNIRRRYLRKFARNKKGKLKNRP